MRRGVQLSGERAEVRREWLVTGAAEGGVGGGDEGGLAAPARPGGGGEIRGAQSGSSSMQAPPSPGSQIAMTPVPSLQPCPSQASSGLCLSSQD